MSVTFNVHDVKPTENRLLEATTTLEALRTRLKTEPEAWSEQVGLVKSNLNPLLGAVEKAWNNHLPLSLSPDAVWLTISQGLATHINENAEELRKQFVQHEGKKELFVDRGPSFKKGNRDNDWPGVFGDFSIQIKDYIGKKHDLIVSSFSTTGPVEKAASEVVLMDAMKSYFEYTVRTMCGFPRITLEGTKADWQNIIQRVRALSEFGLEWWTPTLVDVLETMVLAFDGTVHKQFWGSCFKYGGGSGGPFVSGWINAFFPYLGQGRGLHKNGSFEGVRARGGWSNHYGHETPEGFPSGVAVAPFLWKDLTIGQEYKMDFVGGLLGISVAADGTVRPEIGWAIRDRKDEPHTPSGLKEREARQRADRARNEAYWKEQIAKDPSLADRLNRGGHVERVGYAVANPRSIARAILDRPTSSVDEYSRVNVPADPHLASVRQIDPAVLEARLQASKAATDKQTELQTDLEALKAVDRGSLHAAPDPSRAQGRIEDTGDIVPPGKFYAVTEPEYIGGMGVKIDLFSEPYNKDKPHNRLDEVKDMLLRHARRQHPHVIKGEVYVNPRSLGEESEPFDPFADVKAMLDRHY